jgi:hypothetical protein
MMIGDFSAPPFHGTAGNCSRGMPALHTAADTDDGNTVLREGARKALRGFIVSG